jgi:peptidyl-prolyl cis-trans isomerase D
MISWIQRSFHKHTKLVFFFLLVAVAVPFVFMGVWSGNGSPTVKLNKRDFFHVNLGNEEQVRRMFNDADLSAQLKEGYNALQGAQLQQYAFQRVAGIALAEQLHLPVPTAEQVSAYVLTLRAFHNEQGQFDHARYSQFSDMLKTGAGISGADVNRVLRDDARLAELGKVVGGPGYVLPYDVKQQLIRADSLWTIQVATLDYATFEPTIPTTDDVLKKFHEDNEFRYEIPARPRLSYVEFKTADFVPPVAPSEAEARAFYTANQARFPVPADADKKDATPSLSADGAVDNFPKVRTQVETALKESAALRFASKAATDLTVALYEQKITANSVELNTFLAGQRRPAVAIAPFAPYAPPAEMEWLGYYAETLSRLNQERFFTDPLQTPNGFVVLFWSETLPAHKPLFNEVRDRVLADYKETEKRKLFVERGRALRTQLQTASLTADAFNKAATAEKLDVKSYANFSLREQPPQDLPYPALSALQNLEQGKVSDMIATGDKGYLVYAQEKKVPDLTPANPRYAELEQQLMTFTAGTNENSYLGRMVEAELKRTEPAGDAQ